MYHRKFYYSLLSSVFLLGSTSLLLAMEGQDEPNSHHPGITLNSEDYQGHLMKKAR